MVKLSKWFSAILVSLCLMFSFAVPALAQESNYSCGAYGASPYQENVCGATTETPSSTLENTGQKILPFVIPVAMILAGTLLLYRTRRKKPRPTSDHLSQ